MVISRRVSATVSAISLLQPPPLPRTPSAPSAFLRRRRCCPPRRHRARAQRSRSERARRTGVHPRAKLLPASLRLPPLVPGGETADSPGRRALGRGGPAEAAEGVRVRRRRSSGSHGTCSREQVPARLQRPQCTGRARRRLAAAEVVRDLGVRGWALPVFLQPP